MCTPRYEKLEMRILFSSAAEGSSHEGQIETKIIKRESDKIRTTEVVRDEKK